MLEGAETAICSRADLDVAIPWSTVTISSIIVGIPHLLRLPNKQIILMAIAAA